MEVTADDWKHTSQLETDYKPQKKSDDLRWGQIQVFEGAKGQKNIIAKERNSNKQSNAKKYIQQAKERMKQNSTGLLKLLDFSCSVQKSFCATNYKITEFWESFGTPLAEEVTNRKKDNSGFNDKELTYALFYCTHAGAFLNDNDQNHNEITPEFISIQDQDKFEYKLIDRQLRDEGLDQIIFNQLASERALYLAPEIFENTKQLGKMEKVGSVDHKKSDAFSLGMSILRAGVMKDLQDCYNKEKFVFNVANLAKHIQTFQQSYTDNPLLCESLSQLLEVNPEKRWNLQYLRSELPPLQEIRDYYNDGNVVAENNPATEIQVSAPPIARAGQEQVYRSIAPRDSSNVITSTPVQISSSQHFSHIGQGSYRIPASQATRVINTGPAISRQTQVITNQHPVQHVSSSVYYSSPIVQRSPSNPVKTQVTFHPSQKDFSAHVTSINQDSDNPLHKRYFSRERNPSTSANKQEIKFDQVSFKGSQPKTEFLSEAKKSIQLEPLRSSFIQASNPVNTYTRVVQSSGLNNDHAQGTISRRVVQGAGTNIANVERRTYSSGPTTRVISSSQVGHSGHFYHPIISSSSYGQNFNPIITRSSFNAIHLAQSSYGSTNLSYPASRPVISQNKQTLAQHSTDSGRQIVTRVIPSSSNRVISTGIVIDDKPTVLKEKESNKTELKFSTPNVEPQSSKPLN